MTPSTNALAIEDLRKRVHALEHPKSAPEDEPIWIVNRLGELGVFVLGRAHFLYKGDNLRYSDDVPYRRVLKREFGECQHSEAQQAAGQHNGGDYYHDEADENAHGLWVESGEPPDWHERTGPDFVLRSGQ